MAPRQVSTLAAAALAAAALTALGACGVGEQDGLTRINPDDLGGLDQTVPELATTADSTTTVPKPSPTSAPPASAPDSAPDSTPDTEAAQPTPATMYFISGEGLVPVPVDLPASAVQSVRSYLDALGAGPPVTAAEQGIRSAIPPELVNAVQIRSGGITIDLDGELLSTVDTLDQQLLIGQLVLSITDLPDTAALRTLDRVRFTLDGAPLPVLRRDNSRTEPGEFVTADDYTQLLVDGS